LILSHGDFTTFVDRPISAVSLGLAALVLLAPMLPALARRRKLRRSISRSRLGSTPIAEAQAGMAVSTRRAQ
jgi:TctA family transporter